MYDRFPNGRLSEVQVHKIIKLENDMKKLIKQGYFTVDKMEGIHFYGLGPSALSLVVALKTENLTKESLKLNKEIKLLTFSLFLLTVILVIKTLLYL